MRRAALSHTSMMGLILIGILICIEPVSALSLHTGESALISRYFNKAEIYASEIYPHRSTRLTHNSYSTSLYLSFQQRKEIKLGPEWISNTYISSYTITYRSSPRQTPRTCSTNEKEIFLNHYTLGAFKICARTNQQEMSFYSVSKPHVSNQSARKPVKRVHKTLSGTATLISDTTPLNLSVDLYSVSSEELISILSNLKAISYY